VQPAGGDDLAVFLFGCGGKLGERLIPGFLPGFEFLPW